jgi:hypothetical protein
MQNSNKELHCLCFIIVFRDQTLYVSCF